MIEFLAGRLRIAVFAVRISSASCFATVLAFVLPSSGVLAQPSVCESTGTALKGGLIGESPVAHIAASANGAVLSHPRDGSLTRFDALLKGASVLGRRGQGPGEFEWISGIGFAGASAWAYDGTLRRLTVFDQVGKLQATHDLRSVASLGRADLRVVAYATDSTMYAGYLAIAASRALQDYRQLPVVRLTLRHEGTWRVDTLGSLRQKVPSFTIATSATSARTVFLPELTYNDLLAASASGRWLAWTEHVSSASGRPTTIRVHLFSTRTQETVVYSVSTAGLAFQLTAAQRRVYLGNRFRGADDLISPESWRVVDALLEANGDIWAVVRALHIDDDGTVRLAFAASELDEFLWTTVVASPGARPPNFRSNSTVFAFRDAEFIFACNLGDSLPTVRRANSRSTVVR